MKEMEKFNITATDLTEDGREAVFVAEPLVSGYGITIGNSLRRVLLSTIPGYAATSIRIDGVLHEISACNGVKEDVPEIVLNVKGIVAKLFSDEAKTVVIDVTILRINFILRKKLFRMHRKKVRTFLKILHLSVC